MNADPCVNARVLFAEDNPINQEITLSMLEFLGCRVTVVENGEQAVQSAAQQDFDLVLMDCQMPVMDGFEATREIRRQHAAALAPRQDRLPIIALTADDHEDIKHQCLAAGMDDYLGKPVTPRQLQEVLNKWLQAARCGENHLDQQPVADHDADDDPLQAESLENLRALQKPGGPSLLVKLIDVYFDNSPDLMDKIKQSIETRNGKQLYLAAYTLKSSSATLGAMRVYDLCMKLELLGKYQDTEAARELLDQLTIEYQVACAALSLELDRVVDT